MRVTWVWGEKKSHFVQESQVLTDIIHIIIWEKGRVLMYVSEKDIKGNLKWARIGRKVDICLKGLWFRPQS